MIDEDNYNSSMVLWFQDKAKFTWAVQKIGHPINLIFNAPNVPHGSIKTVFAHPQRIWTFISKFERKPMLEEFLCFLVHARTIIKICFLIKSEFCYTDSIIPWMFPFSTCKSPVSKKLLCLRKRLKTWNMKWKFSQKERSS